MSRIGKRPITLPAGVSVTIDGAAVTTPASGALRRPAWSRRFSSSSSFIRVRRLETVWKFVSMPPSQRWLT